jgi:PDZ domain-containing secreted protein
MDKIRQITIIILILFSVFCAEISEATALLPGLTLHKEKDNVVVLDVQRGSKAWEVGIKRGDILLKIDGQEIKILDDYVKKTKSTSRDETVTLIFLRHGEEYVIIKDSNNYHKKNKVIEQSETVGGSTVDYEIVETKFIGTQSNNRMMYKIVVNPTITREQVKPTAGKIIKAITSKDKDIDEITLFFYSDRSVIDEAYDIASVDWGYPENEGI